MAVNPAWASAQNILAIRLDSLGDVLMTTPAIRALKESGPAGRKITLLTSPVGARIAPYVPEVDAVVEYDAPWMKATETRTGPQADHALASRLQQARFDAAVIFTVYSQSPLPAALMSHLAGIPLRLAHCRENPYQLLTDWVPDLHPTDNGRHEVQRQLDLVAAVGAHTQDERLSLRPKAADVRSVQKMLGRYNLGKKPWVVIHPGASAPSRRYPPEMFAAAARTLVNRHGIQVVFTGVSQEGELVDAIQKQMETRSQSLAGQLSLGEMAALLSLAPLLIANNTGPVHMAAALGTPVVDLYALTNPQHTPWKVPHRVLNFDVPCKFCYKSVCPEGHHDCLRKVTPGEVVKAARELLAEAARAGNTAARRNRLRKEYEIPV